MAFLTKGLNSFTSFNTKGNGIKNQMMTPSSQFHDYCWKCDFSVILLNAFNACAAIIQTS